MKKTSLKVLFMFLLLPVWCILAQSEPYLFVRWEPKRLQYIWLSPPQGTHVYCRAFCFLFYLLEKFNVQTVILLYSSSGTMSYPIISSGTMTTGVFFFSVLPSTKV